MATIRLDSESLSPFYSTRIDSSARRQSVLGDSPGTNDNSDNAFQVQISVTVMALKLQEHV
jgi:hypothetical protein